MNWKVPQYYSIFTLSNWRCMVFIPVTLRSNREVLADLSRFSLNYGLSTGLSNYFVMDFQLDCHKKNYFFNVTGSSKVFSKSHYKMSFLIVVFILRFIIKLRFPESSCLQIFQCRYWPTLSWRFLYSFGVNIEQPDTR